MYTMRCFYYFNFLRLLQTTINTTRAYTTANQKLNVIYLYIPLYAYNSLWFYGSIHITYIIYRNKSHTSTFRFLFVYVNQIFKRSENKYPFFNSIVNKTTKAYFRTLQYTIYIHTWYVYNIVGIKFILCMYELLF